MLSFAVGGTGSPFFLLSGANAAISSLLKLAANHQTLLYITLLQEPFFFPIQLFLTLRIFNWANSWGD